MSSSLRSTILITGASSGLGAALAAAYAAPGVRLALCGRNGDRLFAVAQAARTKGAEVSSAAFDLRDTDALATFIAEVEQASPISLAILNAGVLEGTSAKGEPEDVVKMRTVIGVNLQAALEVFHAVLPGMRRRRSGQIVLISSIAALTPLPDAPAYSASKAGLLSYGLAMRDALAPDGITVTTICPGYVTTPMTEIHAGPHPFEMPVDRAAARIRQLIARKGAVYGFPWPLYWGARLSQWLPSFVKGWASASLRFHIRDRRDA